MLHSMPHTRRLDTFHANEPALSIHYGRRTLVSTHRSTVPATLSLEAKSIPRHRIVCSRPSVVRDRACSPQVLFTSVAVKHGMYQVQVADQPTYGFKSEKL